MAMLTSVSLVRLGQMADSVGAALEAQPQDYFSEEMLISRRDTKQAAEVTTRPNPFGSVAAHVEHQLSESFESWVLLALCT